MVAVRTRVLMDMTLFRFLPTLLALLGMTAGLRAADAVLSDGQQLSGSIRFTSAGRLEFVAGPRILPIERVRRVRFPAVSVVPLRAGPVHRVVLRDGQRLTGELLGVDAKTVRLRTAWAAHPLQAPRGAVLSLGHPPGQLPLFDDDFEGDLKSWKLIGAPAVNDKEHTSGQHGLLLDTPGQQAEYALSVPLGSGQVGINFLDPGPTAGTRWQGEAEFAGRDGPRILSIALVGPGNRFRVRPPEGPAIQPTLPRQSGWHRLEIHFADDRLDVLVDETVLWSSPNRRGPGGPLRAFRLKCQAGQKSNGESVFLDDFHIARTVAELSRPDGDSTRDEIYFREGDQLFGMVRGADRRGIDAEGRFGRRSFAWGEVRAVYFRRQVEPRRATEGVHVRLKLRPTAAAGLDHLEGVLRKLDEKHLTLLHAALGEVAVNREYLRQIQGVFPGRRLEPDGGACHLGPR